jgi:hypothetical protein
LLALALLSRGDFDAKAVTFTSLLSLLWLALFFITGDRRLFFPFSIQYALEAAFFGRRSFAAIAAGAFLLIRIAQAATFKVLAVELAVAIVVLGISLAAYGSKPRGWTARLGWSAFGSLLAFLGLAL